MNEMNKTESEIDWDKISPYNQQMLSSFGYSHPDKECVDWENDSLTAQDSLNYKELGCMCCDNLLTIEQSPLGNNRINIRCSKEHRLIVGILKEDLE